MIPWRVARQEQGQGWIPSRASDGAMTAIRSMSCNAALAACLGLCFGSMKVSFESHLRNQVAISISKSKMAMPAGCTI